MAKLTYEELKSVRIMSMNGRGFSRSKKIDYLKITVYKKSENERVVHNEEGVWIPITYGKSFQNLTLDQLIDSYITHSLNQSNDKPNGITGYDIVQDPWLETVPEIRRYGLDPYYLSNGSSVYIDWDHLEVGGDFAGGIMWDDNGKEKKSFNSYDKSKIVKSVLIFHYDNNETSEFKILGTSIVDVNEEDDIESFSGEISDLDLLDMVVEYWNKQVPGYNVSVCPKNNESCSLIEYKSPIFFEEVNEEVIESEDVVLSSSDGVFTFNVETEGIFRFISNSVDVGEKSNKEVGDVSKEKSTPSADIGYLEIIDESDMFIFQDIDESLLGDEYRESEFSGDEEVPEDSIIDPEVSSYADTFEKTTTYVPSGNYDLDIIPGEYLDNNKNPLILCKIDNGLVNVKIAEKYLEMRDAAKTVGIDIKINSAFRSPYIGINAVSSKGNKVSASSQDYLYTSYLKMKEGVSSYVYDGVDTSRKGQTIKTTKGSFNLAARPGRSNHGSGIGLDINIGGNSSSRYSGVRKDAYIWLVKNSWKFGFVRSVSNEEWHFDYLPEIAKKGPYGKLGQGKPQKDTGSVRTKFYANWGLDTLQGPDWGSTINIQTT